MARKAATKPEPETLLSNLEVAQRFGISGSALTRAVAQGQIRTETIAGRTRYVEADVVAVANQGRGK